MAWNRFSTRLTIALFAGLFINGLAVGSARLSGHVTDKKNHAIEGVNVRADWVNNPGSWETKTDINGQYELMVETPVEGNIPFKPTNFFLSQNYPNPFNPGTAFEYSIAAQSDVRIDLFDILGRHIKTLVNGRKGPGSYTGRWDGTDDAGTPTPAGIYIELMQAGKSTLTKKWVKDDGAAAYSPGNFEAIQPLQKTLSPKSSLGEPDVYNISFTKDGASIETITNYTIQPDETEKVLNMKMNLSPVIQMNGGILTTPNAILTIATGAQISDPDDNLERLVISSGEGDASAEITGIEKNSKLQINLTENFIGKKNIAIKVSDGRTEVQQKFDVTTEGNSFTTRAVDWETDAAITDTLHIIAESLDKSDTTYYQAISTDGNLVLHVKPGTYNIYIRDELEHFNFDNYYMSSTGFGTREMFEQNKYEFLKIGKWYDRFLGNIDLSRNQGYQPQFMIGEELDMNFDDSFPYPGMHVGKILAKFDYPSFFWMSAGYDYFHQEQDPITKEWSIKPDGYSYSNTVQNDPGLNGPGPIWDKILRGEKVFVFQEIGNLRRFVSPYRNETTNDHAVETYVKAEADILRELNPDWFEMIIDNNGPDEPSIDFDITNEANMRFSWIIGKAGSNVAIHPANNILKNFDYPSQEGENLVRKHIMSNMMAAMGLPGKFMDWFFYSTPYDYYPGVMRASGRIDKGSLYSSDYIGIPSTWERRDKAAILYYYKTNDRDPTHVLVD